MALFAWGCHSTPPAVLPVTPIQNTTPAATPSQADPAPSPHHEAFDGDKAFALLTKQCDFGSRTLGSEAHQKTLAFLLSEMRKYADNTLTQKFTYHGMPVTNVIGVFNPAGSDKPSSHPILLMAHWDSRPISDGPFSTQTKQGVVFRFRNGTWSPEAPIPAADDGASGVAVLLELARIFKANKPASGVLLLLDDGEDWGDFRANNDAGDGVEMGSRYFAQHYRETPDYGQPAFGILLDMVGAKDAFFPREGVSEERAKLYDDKVFGAAKRLGYEEMFPNDKTQRVEDDHVAINDAGIPMIDLIHPLPFNPYEQTGYVYWHTQSDTPDKCSAKTLKAVGDVVAEVVYGEPK